MARGALAAEALLLERLEELLAAARSDPSLLALPVRIVVPSRSLRSHVAAAIVRRRGRSVAGVMVQTLHGLAFEVLERSGETAPRGLALAGILAQRFARKEPDLQRGLDGLVDGYTAVAGTVRDLLDAGLEPVHAEPFDEALATDGRHVATRNEVERARALVRVAARTETALRELGLGRLSTLLRSAAELIEEDPDRALPARALFVHGFADATGVATDLLQTLVRQRDGQVILDRPPDPGAGSLGAAGAETAYTERLAERLSTIAKSDLDAAPAAPEPRVESFEAVGTDAEVREAAVRIRALLDGGARPEAIGVVARDLVRYRLALRRHFERLGIPFSGGAVRGALEPAGRRALAFLELLRRGEDVPADRWLDALASLPATTGRVPLGGLRVDLRLAFSALGTGRLRDVADLPVDRALPGRTYALPIRQGLRSEAASEEAEVDESAALPPGSGGTQAARRRVETVHIRRAVRAAGRLRERLTSWPDQAPASKHFERLREVLLRDLGWDRDADESRAVLDALDGLAHEVPPDFPLTRDELRLLLASALKNAGTSELGGRGGGVQALSVMESRGRTFDHLFVLGLNRDVFPRGVHEDPLLSDDLRRILRRVLPDVPVKRSGFDEERYLFAQLLSASPAVTLSWQIADEDGKPLSPSPLVGRLRGNPEPAKAPSLFAFPGEGKTTLRPAFEQAVLTALYAPRRRFGGVLRFALQEARFGLEDVGLAPSPVAVASARLAVLDELDPDRRTPEGRAAAAGLGPFFGFVGSLAATVPSEADPRRKDLYVTSLEGLAACPWQLFLGRLLQVEPTPDPLEALPGADPLLLGNLVHAALERVVREASPDLVPPDGPTVMPLTDLSERLARVPVPVRWPAPEELDAWVREEADRLLAGEGLFLPGLTRALAERVRPLLDAAREVDWSAGEVPVLGAEVEGLLPVRDAHGRIRSVRFKADRVDRIAAGNSGLRWTDYKTGKPISEKKTPEKRRSDFLERVRTGSNLQGVAYLLATEGHEQGPVGRYLFLRRDVEEREFVVETGDRDFGQAFGAAVESVLGAWDEGSFFPRVVDPKGQKEPARCSFCAVSEACLRHDSGSRLRLFEWTERARGLAAEPELAPQAEPGFETPPPSLTSSESALLRVWRLPVKEGDEGNGHGGGEA